MTIYNIMFSIVVFGWNWVTRSEIPFPVSTKGIYNLFGNLKCLFNYFNQSSG